MIEKERLLSYVKEDAPIIKRANERLAEMRQNILTSIQALKSETSQYNNALEQDSLSTIISNMMSSFPIFIPSPFERDCITVIGFLGNQSSNLPLIVKDGQVVPNGSTIKININYIESIQILKDKSATDQYGEEAANGVIVITTKGKANSGS